MDGIESLDAFIARLRKLSESAQEEIAKEAAPLVAEVSKRTAAAGTDPYGKPWALRKDGQRAIPNAAEAIDVVARGNLIVIRVRRGAAIQNYLSPERRRQVIPDPLKPIPEDIQEAIRTAAERVFAKATGS